MLIFTVMSAVGAMARFGVERWSVRQWGERWPWGPLGANIGGSFVLGLAIAQPAHSNQLIAIQAFCGAFTTFGGFIAQSWIRLRHAETVRTGALYLLLTFAGSLAAAALGMAIAPGA